VLREKDRHREQTGRVRSAIRDRQPRRGVLRYERRGNRARLDERLGLAVAELLTLTAARRARHESIELRERAVDDGCAAGEHLAKISILDEDPIEEVARLLAPPQPRPRGGGLRRRFERRVEPERRVRRQHERRRLVDEAGARHAALEADAATALDRAREAGA